MNNTYFVYELITGKCTNLIIWDGVSYYKPKEGFALEMRNDKEVNIGWIRIAENQWQAPNDAIIEEISTPEPENAIQE
jgi:hypothetical protein